MADHAATYDDGRRRLTALVEQVGDERAAATTVPATPDWTVKDVLAHVAGIADDLVNMNLDGVGTDRWNAAQVDKRRDWPLSRVTAEWAEQTEPLLTMLAAAPPEVTGQLIGDQVTHELDVRGALGDAAARDTDGVTVALGYYATMAAHRVGGAGLPVLRLEAGGDAWASGDGEPAAVVSGSPFELLRALTGRRTADEVAGLTWTGDASPYLPLLSNYGWPDGSLGE